MIRNEQRLLAAITFLGTLSFVARTIWAGQDANWDLQNYHDYTAYALLNWRYASDVGAGGFQSYFNPLIYLLPFGLRHALPPMSAAIALSATQSIIVVPVWLLSSTLLPPNTRHRTLLRALASIVGIASATTLCEIGTSFADLPLATFMLGALLCLILGDSRMTAPTETDRRKLVILAGFLAGATAGLKLTNAVGCIALVLAAIPQRQSQSTTTRRIAGIVAGGLAGFTFTGGAWSAFLWIHFSNPVFPAYNRLFRSRSAALSNFADDRFLPRGWLDALSYPFRIAVGEHPTAEVYFAEPRFALLLIVALTAIAVATIRFLRRTVTMIHWQPWQMNLDKHSDHDLAYLRITIFLIAGSLLWMRLFSIERYAIVYEITAGILLIITLVRVIPSQSRPLGCVGMAIATLSATQVPDMWHRSWSDTFATTLPDVLRRPATYILVASPLGYWASILPARSRFLSTISTEAGLRTAGILGTALQDDLRHPPTGLVRTLGYDVPMSGTTRDALSAMGLVPSAPCLRMRSLWWVDTIVCDAKEVGNRAHAAADLAPGVQVDFSSAGSGWIYLGDGWANAGSSGTAMITSTADLFLALPSPVSSQVIEIDFRSSSGGSKPTGITLFLDGQDTVHWLIRADGIRQKFYFCVPILPRTKGNVLSIGFRRDTIETVPAADPDLAGLIMRSALPSDCSSR